MGEIPCLTEYGAAHPRGREGRAYTEVRKEGVGGQTRRKREGSDGGMWSQGTERANNVERVEGQKEWKENSAEGGNGK